MFVCIKVDLHIRLFFGQIDKPITSVGYLTRIQIELIDMRCSPDGTFKWILHVKDHSSKFSWAYPLESEDAESVAEKLLNQFYSFGAPLILQSNNGNEFVARVIKVCFKNISNEMKRNISFFVGYEKDLGRFSNFKWSDSTSPNTKPNRT
jgi:hypothetical protein